MQCWIEWVDLCGQVICFVQQYVVDDGQVFGAQVVGECVDGKCGDDVVIVIEYGYCNVCYVFEQFVCFGVVVVFVCFFDFGVQIDFVVDVVVLDVWQVVVQYFFLFGVGQVCEDYQCVLVYIEFDLFVYIVCESLNWVLVFYVVQVYCVEVGVYQQQYCVVQVGIQLQQGWLGDGV